MKKEDLLTGLWFWRTNDGYFKKINSPFLVIENSKEVIKIKMFKKSGEVEEITLNTENDLDALIKQSKPCKKKDVKAFFKNSLNNFEKTKNESQSSIDKLTSNLLLID